MPQQLQLLGISKQRHPACSYFLPSRRQSPGDYVVFDSALLKCKDCSVDALLQRLRMTNRGKDEKEHLQPWTGPPVLWKFGLAFQVQLDVEEEKLTGHRVPPKVAEQ